MFILAMMAGGLHLLSLLKTLPFTLTLHEKWGLSPFTALDIGRFVHCESSLSIQLQMFLTAFGTGSLRKWMQALLSWNFVIEALSVMVI